MKKNRLSFLIVSSLLAISALAGCETTPPAEGSKAGDTSTNINTSIDGGTSDGGQGTSDGGQGTSDGGQGTSDGGGQQTKTDWTDAEKQIMTTNLHGIVLPFVAMDVTVQYVQKQESVYIQSSANMAAGFLASYKEEYEKDGAGWVGGDISYDFGVSNGCVFAYQKAVTVNGAKRYVMAIFGGVDADASGRVNYSPTNKFYLQAYDPYEYEFPSTFIGQWLSQVYGSNIVPPAFNAEYYSLDEEGVLYGYSETNIENDYKVAVERSGNFTIDPEKDAQGYYVCHANDGAYIMYFKYDAQEKTMILKVDVPKGWNAAAINAIFANHNMTAFELPVMSGSNVTFNVNEQESGGVNWVTISAGNVTTTMVQEYVNALKALGYKVNVPTVDPNDSYYMALVNVFTNEGMYTLYVNYYKDVTPYPFTISFQLNPNTTVVKQWPATSIAEYLKADKDVAPAFAGTAYGYTFEVQSSYAHVVVHVDEGSETQAQESYASTLVGAGYTPDGTFKGQPRYKSANSEIYLTIGCDPEQIPGEIDILVQRINVVATPWPTEQIANLINGLGSNITDTLPVLDVSNAKECYVSNTYREVRIEGIGADFENTAKAALKDSGYVYNQYYYFDYNEIGAFVSPNKQFVVYVYTVGNDVMLALQAYWPMDYKVVGLGGNWNYNDSLLFLVDATVQSEVDDGWYVTQSKVEFDVNADDEFKVTDGGDWFGFDKLEANANFSRGNEGNIKANAKGHVVLYLKTFSNGSKGIAISFAADAPELKPWPEQEILAFFGEGTFASIPEIKLADASYEAVGTLDQDGVKVIAIMVTVADAPTQMAIAIRNLESEFRYSYDNELEGYVSSNEGFPVYAFTANDDNSFIVSIAYFAPAAEPAFKVVGLDNNWAYDDGLEFDEVEDLPEGYVAQSTATFHVDRGAEFKLFNGTTWLGSDELVANESFGSDGDKNIIAKASGDVVLTFSILADGSKQISIAFTADEEQPTTLNYKLIPDDDWGNLVAGDAVFYAWVWGGNHGEGEWIELDIDRDNHCFYLNNIDVNATGFKVVRMNPNPEGEIEVPSWEAKWNESPENLSFPTVGLKIHFDILP